MATRRRGLAIAVVAALGIISLVIGAVFIFEGFVQQSTIVQAMQIEKSTYTADGINGVIDTPEEAAIMAAVLRQHRVEGFGYYTELKRDDPKRTEILKAMTMENSLNLARLGFGVTTVLKVVGVFMAIVGIALILLVLYVRPRLART